MSQTNPHHGINICQCERREAVELEADVSPDIFQYLPPNAKLAHLQDSISSKYLEMAEKEDKCLYKPLSTIIDKTVIFAALFSASVAVLISVSIQDLKPVPQDASTFYLSKIYQLLAEPNASNASPLANPPAFSPPKYAIWVNSLWFLSLSISLACALLGTLQQHWIHQYLIIQAVRLRPSRVARIHMFRHEAIDKSGFAWMSSITNALIQMSLFLFFIGLLIYLFNVNHIAFYAILWFIVTSAMIYLIITLMPVYCSGDTPYGSPFSPLVCRAFAAIICWIFDALSCYRWVWHPDTVFLRSVYRNGLKRACIEVASEPSPNIECKILDRTIDGMTIPELEWAFRRFRNPPKIHKYKWSSAVARFSSSTFFSGSLSGWEKIRRLDLCMKVADLADVRKAGLDFLYTVLDQHHVLRYFAKPGDIMRGKLAEHDQQVGFWAQILIAVIIADVQRDDHGWIALVKDQLRESRYIGQDYHHPGDNTVLLINLTHIINQIIRCWKDQHGLARAALPRIFLSLSKFHIRDTPSELQNNFLALWDEIDRNATTTDRNATDSEIYRLIRENLSNFRHGLPATRGRNDAHTAPYSGPRGDPPDTTFLDNSVNENTHTTITPTDYISQYDNNADPPPRPPFPIPKHAIAEPTDRSPPGGASDESKRIAQLDISSQSTPEPLKPPGPPPDSVANLPTDVASVNISSGGVRPPRPAPISVPSPATPQVASAPDPGGTATAPFSTCHEVQDLKDPVETELAHISSQSDPSAEHRDRTSIDTAVPHHDG